MRPLDRKICAQSWNWVCYYLIDTKLSLADYRYNAKRIDKLFKCMAVYQSNAELQMGSTTFCVFCSLMPPRNMLALDLYFIYVTIFSFAFRLFVRIHVLTCFLDLNLEGRNWDIIIFTIRTTPDTIISHEKLYVEGMSERSFHQKSVKIW